MQKRKYTSGWHFNKKSNYKSKTSAQNEENKKRAIPENSIAQSTPPKNSSTSEFKSIQVDSEAEYNDNSNFEAIDTGSEKQKSNQTIEDVSIDDENALQNTNVEQLKFPGPFSGVSFPTLELGPATIVAFVLLVLAGVSLALFSMAVIFDWSIIALVVFGLLPWLFYIPAFRTSYSNWRRTRAGEYSTPFLNFLNYFTLWTCITVLVALIVIIFVALL